MIRVVLLTKQNKKMFKLGHKKKSFMTLLYLIIIVFPKLDPLTATGMALFVILGPNCQNLFPLFSD